MGIFHKTLKDYEKAVEEGRLRKARKIIQDHIKDFHSLQSDTGRLVNEIARFQRMLLYFDVTLSGRSSVGNNLKEIKDKIKEAEQSIVWLKRLANRVSEMADLEK